MQSTEYRHFRNAVLFSFVLAIVAAIFLLTYGKNNSFLVINGYNSPAFDNVFRFWTYLGDGMIWVPLFVYVIFFKRDFLIAAIAGVIISTIISQGLKNLVFPNQFRPIVILAEKVRTIPGYYINRAHSFPSGHTCTAFTLALLLAYVVKGRFWVFFFPLVAFFVGYSRVYLAQHFVTDVFAGILVGIVSAYTSLLLYEKFRKKRIQMPAASSTEEVV